MKCRYVRRGCTAKADDDRAYRKGTISVNCAHSRANGEENQALAKATSFECGEKRSNEQYRTLAEMEQSMKKRQHMSN